MKYVMSRNEKMMLVFANVLCGVMILFRIFLFPVARPYITYEIAGVLEILFLLLLIFATLTNGFIVFLYLTVDTHKEA